LKLIIAPSTDWNAPYSFFNHVFAVTDEEGNFQRDIKGAMGSFVGVW